MVNTAQIDFYREHGFLTVDSFFAPEEMAEARAVVDDLVERSRGVADHTDLYDLEPGHTPESPRVRRLKNPIAAHPVFERLARSGRLLDLVAALIGPQIRLHGNKLNMKSAEYGSPVQWHQDLL